MVLSMVVEYGQKEFAKCHYLKKNLSGIVNPYTERGSGHQWADEKILCYYEPN
jgi:hypothetical protein